MDPIVDMPERFTNDIDMIFVRIPAGEFWRGSLDSDSQASGREKPQHRVTISQPFYLAIHPVTQEQWESVMGKNPSQFKGDPQRPVENVSWHDVQQFLERLSASDNRIYTLPSEAQWEYACRAGSTGMYCFGDDISLLSAYAWYSENADNTTHRVGQKQANVWNLYDMHGNVWEWCQDFYDDYSVAATTDPCGPRAGSDRIIRGGSWYYGGQDARAAFRDAASPGDRNGLLGFRCVASSP